MKHHVALLAAAALCLASLPAAATIHLGNLGKDDDKDHGKSVLLHPGPDDHHGKIGTLPLIHIPKFDLSDLDRHDNGKHLGWFKKGPKGPKHHDKPGKPGDTHPGPVGGPKEPPSHESPIPEPSAALLFGVGTGMVGLRLRRR